MTLFWNHFRCLYEVVLCTHDSHPLIMALFCSQFPFFTLLGIDYHQMGMPLAWSIQQSEEGIHIAAFLKAVRDTVIKIKPDWKPACFLIDCADAEVKGIRLIFPDVPIYFCTYHVRK